MFLQHYHKATEDTRATGRDWYVTARETVDEYAQAWALPRPMVAGIIAALSQRRTWQVNLRMARLCIAGHRPRGLSAPIDKATAIRNGADPDTVLTGNKIRAFYRAILGDSEAIVLDVHMLRAAGHGKSTTPKQYRELALVLHEEALSVHETPAAYQAIVWCQVRGKAH